jgi:predicted Zn-dependent peptidase
MTQRRNNMNYPGYTLVRREDCPEQHGVLTVLNHDVSGATVLLVENEDTNKAFGIGFGTFPSDDTGVFHILEHSVLAGSEKYPVTSPFLQLLKSSMASFLNAMTFPDKTVYPFATPNETDFRNLMDVYLNAVFCPLAMVDKAVFEQEGWHRDADGTVSGVVYNEMQGALASPDAQLQNALERAMFPDTAYGFVSGGDPASIPALTYEKYQRVYRRHYSADNCCITLYGRMDMAEKLAFLDEHYLSRMPKDTSRPRLTVQDQQNGVRVHIPYYTENPEPDQVQCALAWYTGVFADRERQLGVEILLDALLGTNQSPLKAALLEQKLGADIDIGFDDSTLQPTLELVLRAEAKDIREKYVEPPYTTAFGILFLPFEGLYAEVVNAGLLEVLQRDYQVNIAGPSTMAALLNSLQMGFKTLAIQKRSGEVWQLLGAVKTEFDKFGQGLSKMQQRLRQTDEELDNLIGVRSRAISRKLRAVQTMDESAAAALLELDAEPGRPVAAKLPENGEE